MKTDRETIKTDRRAMKTLSIIAASIILILSYTVNAETAATSDISAEALNKTAEAPNKTAEAHNKTAEALNKKATTKKTETIESILADKNRIQGKVAKRIRTYNIDTWRRLDNYHIFIEGKGKDNDYLIKFKHKCYGTRNGSTLIYKTRNNELTKFDTIGVLDSFINSHDVLRPTRTCIIEDIYHLDNLVTNKSITKGEDSDKDKVKENTEE